MPAITDPTHSKIDRWLRRHEPREELALRDAIRGRFPEAATSAHFKLLAQYGDTNIQQFQRDLIRDCPRNTSAVALGNGCAPLVPSLRQLPCNQEPRGLP